MSHRSLPKDFMFVLDLVNTIVNFIKSRPLASRLFSQFCGAMDLDYKCFLYHTNVRQLSIGKVLSVLKLFLLLDDGKKKDFGFSFHDTIWWIKVTFLSDLFDKLSLLNLSLKVPSENIVTIFSKLKSFGEKLSRWQS